MAAKKGLGCRIALTILAVFVLVIVVGFGELVRRYLEREKVSAIQRVLQKARSDDDPMIEIDPEWEEVAKSLRSRQEDEPDGKFAIMAHRAVLRYVFVMYGVTLLVEHPTVTVRYGDLLGREIPLPDLPFLWTVEMQGSWNKGPQFAWYRGSWEGGGPTEAEIVVDRGLPDADREQESAILKLRLVLRLYLGDNAVAASKASGPEELAGVPFNYQERRFLGNFKITIRGDRTGSQGT